VIGERWYGEALNRGRTVVVGETKQFWENEKNLFSQLYNSADFIRRWKGLSLKMKGTPVFQYMGASDSLGYWADKSPPPFYNG
jgi:hypothetical protein